MEILKKLTNLENEAANFGFKWENPGQIIAQISSELKEIEADLKNKEKLQEEIGDLLHAVFSLCVFCQFEPEETLTGAVNKFERRFRATKELALKEGLKDLNNQPFDKLMALWNKAKNKVG